MAETTSGTNKYWALIIFLLVVTIALGSMVIWSRWPGGRPIEITIPPAPELPGEIYIGGTVNSPGIYPLKGGDTVEALLEAAGGTTGSADLSRLKLDVPSRDEGDQLQKIDINRAEDWLLMALPGIGEVRAKAIVDYRRQHGPFHNINELTKVEGIGTTTYERIRHLITVTE